MAKQKNYLTTDRLMRHLRSSGIKISGSYQKRQLVNHGYYHGYKGYRYYEVPSKRIPISDFKQLVAIIRYDSNLKALFYPHLMFVETALKNITLDIVLREANSNRLSDIFEKLMAGYHNAPQGTSETKRKDIQQQKLKLQNQINDALLQAYRSNHKIITHFYHNEKYEDVPIWAVYEIISLGAFGFFVSCLNKGTREKISRVINLNLSGDTDIRLLERLIFVIKDLRNAVAHNDIVFDTRFKKTGINRPLEVCLKREVGVPYANFKEIVDYVDLVSYILKIIKLPKREIRSFVNSFEKIINDLKKDVSEPIYEQLVHIDTPKKINDLRNYIKT